MQVASITYRLYKQNDINGILNLWEKYSGWGGISEKQFYDWHIHTPNGPCTIVVAETEEGEIIGQMVFRPTKIILHGKDVTAYRAMAPILSETFRGTDIKNFDHPTYAMLRAGIAEAIHKKIELIFFSPSVGWVAVVKTFPVYGLPKAEVSLFNCIGIDIEKIVALPSQKKNNCQVRRGNISSAYEDLWNKFIVNLPVNCAVQRSAGWLAWRRTNDLVLEIVNEESKELKGVIIIKKETGQVLDIIAATLEDMNQTLRCAAGWLSENHIDATISELKLMHTHVAEQVVQGLPWHPVNFRYAFVCFSPLNKTVPFIHEWFIMPDE